MVIHLTDDLINKRKLINDFYHFLFIIMLSYKEGKHFISISPKNIKFLLDDEELKERPELYQILQSYNTHCKAYNLKNFEIYFNIIIKIIPEGREYNEQIGADIEYRYIKYNKFLDSVTIQKTILLGENPSDAEIYKIISDYYQKQKNINYRCLYEARGGGGNTVVKEYKPIHSQEERFCLCILDSDIRYAQQTTYGDTAKFVVDYDKQNTKNYKTTIKIIEVLELENLLPLKFYKDTYSHKSDVICDIEKILSKDSNFKKYFDFKKGVSCKYDIEKATCKEYLKTYFCPLIEKANITLKSEKLLNGFQGKNTDILQDFIKKDLTYIFESINNDSFVKPYWDELGKLIASHILAPNKQRAI